MERTMAFHKRTTLVPSLRRWPLSSVTGGRIPSVLTGRFHRHTHGEPLITLPNYRLVQTDKGLKVDSAIHEVKQAKEQGGKPEFIKCYYPFNNLNDEVLPEAEKVYKALPVKKGK